jgi:hypothetical protein
MTTYTFPPPSVPQGPAAWGNRLLLRVSIDRGLTVIKRVAGTYYESRFPAQTELEEAADYWLGGHVYTIDQTTRDALVAAGYGANITEVVPYGAYGSLPYGQGPYGGGTG